MAEKREPLPEHSPVEHLPGYWMTQTCERCRRQSQGQRKLLAALIPERINAFYRNEMLMTINEGPSDITNPSPQQQEDQA